MSLQEIEAAEQMMKMAINNQNHVDSLVGYYRDLIDQYNQERAEWVLHYGAVATTATDEHLLQQQIEQARAQMADLEQELATRKAQLMLERQRHFKYIESNGVLKDRLDETKANYRDLMSSCKPVGLNNKQLGGVGDSRVLKQGLQPRTAELELELINTNKEHSERKRKLQERIDKLKQQLRELMFEYQQRQEENTSEYDSALNKLTELERKHVSLTTEYFRFRSTNAQEEKRLQEDNEILRLKNLAMVQKLQSLQKSHAEEFKSVDGDVKRENKKFKARYDEQLKKKTEHLQILKEQHERIHDIYTNKMKKLEQELRTTNERIKAAEEKGRVEVGSLKSQIKILRSRLEKEGLHELRKEIAQGEEEEDSSNSLQMSELERINQEVKDLEKNLNIRK